MTERPTIGRHGHVCADPERAPRGLPKDTAAYLKFVDEIYNSDAYHSLSIEGYRVTTELIERIRAGTWNPDATMPTGRTAMRWRRAATGKPFRASRNQSRKSSAEPMPPRLLATPIATGIAKCSSLASPPDLSGASAPGFRNHFAYLQGSRHVPRAGRSFRTRWKRCSIFSKREGAVGADRARSLAVRLHHRIRTATAAWPGFS